MNSNLKWKTLKTVATTVLMYNIIHNLVDIRAAHLLIPSDCRARWNATFRTRYTHDQMYIAFHSFLVPPSLEQHITSGTWSQCHRPVPRQGWAPLSFPCSPRCKYYSTLFLAVNTILILTGQYGHVRSNSLSLECILKFSV